VRVAQTFHALLAKQPSTVEIPSCQPTALMMALAPYIVEPGTPERQEKERSQRKLAIAQELVAKCHEVTAVAETGRTALHSAVTAYYPIPVVLRLTRQLIKCGAVVDARTNYGVTPLMMAVIAKRADVVGQLIGAGADPSARALDGESVVELAQRIGQDAIASLLLRVAVKDAGR
jgi:ankyrin repeat protein